MIGTFNKDFVHTGIFPKEISKKINKAQEVRHASDYDDFYMDTDRRGEGTNFCSGRGSCYGGKISAGKDISNEKGIWRRFKQEHNI